MMEAADDHVGETELEEESSSLAATRRAYILASLTEIGWNLLVAVGLGQTLSLLICGTAVTSGILQQEGVYIPTAQSFLNYILLSLVYTTMLSCRRGDNNILPVLKDRGWKYFLLGVIDVEANYLIVKAYHFTTVTSVQLLDCFTIPTVLVLSWLFLRVRYKVLHVLGVFLCLLGVGSLVFADIMVEKWQGDGPNKVLGDMLCLAGATLYGISNVAQEFAVRNFNKVEFLGMIGLFGSIINGVQFAVLERDEILKIDWQNYKVIVPMVTFAVCLFAMYSLMPVVMKLTSAAAVNLNLLSADFYALLIGLFLFHYKFHVLYFISFGLIIVGIVVYSIRPPPQMDHGGSQYREMRSATTQAETPEPGCQTEITYHSHRTNNGTTESCSVQISKYIPQNEEDRKQLMLHQDEEKRPGEGNEDV